MMSKPLAIVALVIPLAGCINPQDYETTPVQVSTELGSVTCQLYQHDQVIWDRAIAAPAGMSVQDADAVCKRLGQRYLENS